MKNDKSVIHELRQPVETPESLIVDGKAQFGTFKEPFRVLNALDCVKPCGALFPHFLNKIRLTEWEAFELHMDEGALVSAVYNTGTLGFSIFVWFDKRTQKITAWKNFVLPSKVKVASQLVDDHCYLKTKKSEYTIQNDLMNGKARAFGYSTSKKSGNINLDVSVERLSPPSNVSIPFGVNKPLYSEKDFLKATGYIEVNGERFMTNENSVSIIDDHKGYYPFFAHYEWLTTMGRMEIDGSQQYFALNLTKNQSTDPEKYNENIIWIEGKSYPLPPVTFDIPSKKATTWHIKDQHGMVDIKFEISDVFYLPIHAIVIDAYYALPYGKIYGYVKNEEGKVFNVDGMLGIGENKTTRM
ncbi:MAG: DUF2804 family protein [Bacillota bacterium]